MTGGAGTRPPRVGRRIRRASSLALWAMLASACEPAEPPVAEPLGGTPAADSLSAAPLPLPGEVSFEREITFVSLDRDSLVVVPWLFRSRVVPEAILRDQRVLVARGSAWEELFQESASTPPTRTPWLIVPGSATGLVVGENDRLESLLLRLSTRELELALGSLLTEWPRPGEESVRLLEGRAVFPAGSVSGLVLDISRRWELEGDGSGAPGDWVFLHSGSQLQVFLEEQVAPRDPGAPRSPAVYDGWTRLAFRDLPWDEVVVDWPEVRAFEEARRDVPVRWRFSAPEGGLSGEIEVVSSWLDVTPGDGPILPLSGLFEVRGELEIQGESFPVAGALRHVQR